MDHYGACEVWVGVWRRVWQQWSVMWRPPDRLRLLVKCLVSRVLAESSTVQLIITQNQVSTVHPVHTHLTDSSKSYTSTTLWVWLRELINPSFFLCRYLAPTFLTMTTGNVLLIAASRGRDEEQLQMLCLTSGSASFGEQRRAKSVLIWRLLTNAPSSPCFWRMHHYNPSWPHISQDSLQYPKKKKEREKMATSRGVDRHFRVPGWQKPWCKGKTSGDTIRKSRPSHLTTADEVNKVLVVKQPSLQEKFSDTSQAEIFTFKLMVMFKSFIYVTSSHRWLPWKLKQQMTNWN